jgi:hypothetical protein
MKKKYAQVGANSFPQYQELFKDNNINHFLQSTTNSNTLVTDGGKYVFSDTKIPPKNLHLIKEAKKQIIANAEIMGLKDIKPCYFSLPKIKGRIERVFDVVEIDINSAYWACAFKHGLINEDLYNKGMSVDKVTRLVMFGAAATTKTTYDFDGESYRFQNQAQNDFGRAAFFYVAKEISNVFKEIFKYIPASCFIYWVDAVFLRRDFADYAMGIIESYGYTAKTKKIAWMDYVETDELIEYIFCEYKETDTFCPYHVKRFQRNKHGLNPERAILRAKQAF